MPSFRRPPKSPTTQPIQKPIVSARVRHVPARALAFHALALVQVEEDAK